RQVDRTQLGVVLEAHRELVPRYDAGRLSDLAPYAQVRLPPIYSDPASVGVSVDRHLDRHSLLLAKRRQDRRRDADEMRLPVGLEPAFELHLWHQPQFSGKFS